MATAKALKGIRLALVDFDTGFDAGQLKKIAAAVTYQVQRHFALPPPYGYGISATITAKTASEVLPDEWVVGLFQHPDQPGAFGYHDQTPGGQPLAKVFPSLETDSSLVSVTISHEVLELLADPNTARVAISWDGKFWLYEVADAVEQDIYLINGIKVSNFVLPPYFEPVPQWQGIKLDWLGLVKTPLEIRPGGYGQYFDDKAWKQVTHESTPVRDYRKNLADLAQKRRDSAKPAAVISRSGAKAHKYGRHHPFLEPAG